ncbi:gag-protease polyprotein [Cucumis melo var. makuwa]|uniref:Gag-protease polyprotein n=1 Tax=Cucumis melo var. makuwa TaxID=1194695 RepID=A0A5A7T481_CUCMM|nr:gag-protease polyprotein [Cucumis melo var. makuwa]
MFLCPYGQNDRLPLVRKILPKRGARRGGRGGRGRGAGRVQPEVQPVVQATNPATPVTHVDLTAMEQSLRYAIQQKFLNLEQDDMTVEQYDAEFDMLSRFSSDVIRDEVAKIEKFVKGLRLDIQGLV